MFFIRRHPTPAFLLVGLWLAFSVTEEAGAQAQGPSATQEEPATALPWPVEFEDGGYTVVLYQPQPESFEGNVLGARVAVEMIPTNGSGAQYGTVWLRSRVDTDREERTARIRDVEVDRILFPDTPSEQVGSFSIILNDFLRGQQLDITFDQLLTSLSLADLPDISVEQVNNEPPPIYYRDEAAVLVSIDGDPILEQIDGTNVMVVVNTAFAILLDLDSGRYYLYAGPDLWYEGAQATGPWEFTTAVPSSVSGIIPPPDAEEQDLLATADRPDEPGPPPEIVTVTVPSELIATLGKAQFTPIPGTDLMIVGNTQTDLLFHTPEQQYYVLLSGRWFRSAALEGPWAYVAADALPETFQDIPADSDAGNVRGQVAGTEEAEEAVLDAHIPQTAAISRRDASLQVEYDGDPVLEPIEGTSLSWAVNTATPVVLAFERYYAVSDGVWYEAEAPDGPWIVATLVPSEIYKIPATHPLHFVTYVHVYDSTEEVVYVGYTPGYTNTVVHQTTVIYHTGWVYRPWWGSYYIPRAPAWGWHVRWNPWTGWGVGFTWSNGWFTFGIGAPVWRPWCCYGGWWGPPGYHRGYRAGFYHGYRAGYWAGYAAGRRPSLYRTPGNAPRIASRDAIDRGRPARPANRPEVRPSTRPNAIAADRAGNVHRRTPEGWQPREGGTWGRPVAPEAGARPSTRPSQAVRPANPTTRPTNPTTRPTTRPTSPTTRPGAGQTRPGGAQPSTRPSRTPQQELNRTDRSRDRGAARTQQFNRARGGATPARRPSRGG